MGPNIYVLVSCLVGLSSATNPRVTTPLGIIEGTVSYTYTGSSFYRFEGVPYARPPVGDLRYENPQDPQNWEGILMAKVKTLCYQFTQLQTDTSGNYVAKGDEDCLHYNVYTPTLNRSANLNVLVFIHGGSFMFGQGASWGPEIGLNRNIVLVTINYRLGPLGFLSTQDDVLPGNLGLRDQTQAIRWIKKNIKYFGGNPNSITLSGASAGGASVQFHYLMPQSKGLFKGGHAISGTVLNNWVLMDAPLEKAKQLASIVGCPNNNSKILKQCMKTKSARLIAESVSQFQPFLYNPFSPWSVVVDGYWSSNPVLPDHPLKLLKNKRVYDVPLIISYVTSEGLYPAAEFYSKQVYLDTIDSKWNEVMPHILMYNWTIDHSIINNVSQAIRQKYLGNETLNRGASFTALVQAVGDRTFVADIEKGMKLHSAAVKSHVFGYVYNYRGNQSMSEGFAGTTEDLGVCHQDDLQWLLKVKKSPGTPADIAMSDLLWDMTTSFMERGVPNITSKWKPMSKNVRNRLNLLKIDRFDELTPLQEEHIGERLFWDSLPFNENERLLNISLGF